MEGADVMLQQSQAGLESERELATLVLDKEDGSEDGERVLLAWMPQLGKESKP